MFLGLCSFVTLTKQLLLTSWSSQGLVSCPLPFLNSLWTMTSQNGFDYQLCADGSLNATSRPDITLHCHLDLEMTQGSQIQLFLLFQCLLSFKKKHRFIYLAMPGLSFGMWDQTQVYWEHSLRHWTIRKIPSSSDFFFSW